MEKYCTKCNKNLPIEKFGKSARSPDGIQTRCKLCRNKMHKENKLKRVPIVKPTHGYKTCSTCNTEKHVDEFPLNKWCSLGVHSICKKCNSLKATSWIKDNIDNYKERRNNRNKLKRRKDPVFRLKENVRCLLKDSFKRACEGKYDKTLKMENLLGCDFKYFMGHIESQFESWMNWDNYGKCDSNEYRCTWELDHIIPLSEAKTKKDIEMLSHYSNIQPLCQKENNDKSDNVPVLTNIILNITTTY